MPDHAGLMYFAVTISAASQTAGVSILAPEIRRLLLLQSLMSFGLNTAVAPSP
jgi:uncharacterized membrane protein